MMLNTVLSKQKGHVGFRTTSVSLLSSLQQQRQRPRMVFSPSISIWNTTAAAVRYHYHPQHSPWSSDITCRPKIFAAPEAKRGVVWRHSTGGGGAGVDFQQMDERNKMSYRSFASNSKSSNNRHNTAQRRRSEPVAGRPPTVSDILDDYKQCHEKLKPYQVAATWNKLVKVLQQNYYSSRNNNLQEQRQQRNFWMDHQASLQMLVEQTIQLADQLDGRWTATATYSLVKLLHLTNFTIKKSIGGQVELLPLWNALLHQAVRHIQSEDGFNALDISNLIWAYAKSDAAAAAAAADGIIKVDGRLLGALADKAELCVDDFAPQGLSHVAWGFATMNHKAPSLFDTIARAAPARIHKFTPQNLSNTAWAFAKLNHKKTPLLFDTISSTAQVRINEFNPQDLVNTAWAFAKLNHEAPLLFDAIARAAQVRINEFNAQNLSHTMLAFGNMNHSSPLLFDAIAGAARVGIKKFSLRKLSNTAWAYGKMNHSSPLLFDAIAKAAQVRINGIDPQSLSKMAWAFATLHHEAPLLFDAIARVAQGRINEFKPHELSMLAWAFATLTIESPSLFEAIAQATTTPVVRINEFQQQQEDLANNNITNNTLSGSFNRMEPKNTFTAHTTVSSILLKSCNHVVMQIDDARRKVQQTMRQWWY